MKSPGRRKRPGRWYVSVARRTVFVPFAVAFALGVAMILIGLLWAASEFQWDRDARIGQAVVIEKYIKPSDDQVVDSRVVYEIEADGARLRGELRYPVYMGWEKLKVGDGIEIEYLPSGEARLPEATEVGTGLILALFGIPLLIVGGAVAYVLVRLEMGAGRLTPETIAAAFNNYSD